MTKTLLVNSLLGVALQIPTRRVTQVGKQGMNAWLVLRLVKIEVGPAVLLGHCVVALYSYYSERLAIGRDSKSNR
jgi:hypothetical protein